MMPVSDAIVSAMQYCPYYMVNIPLQVAMSPFSNTKFKLQGSFPFGLYIDIWKHMIMTLDFCLYMLFQNTQSHV